MKLLELRLENLNSLYGKWRIDFQNPEYAANGIFALSGATGAGKSTILDAICLALYGRTPRLDKFSKSENEIMSRQTGHCSAELLFEAQGAVYRSTWAQQRAYKKAGGELQAATHELSDADGSLIESKLSETKRVIQEKTGMDFARFTRSVLLAQGGFDAFLKAETDEKAAILEKLTDTQLYSAISVASFERKKQEEEKLQALRQEVVGIEILEPEQEQQKQADLRTQQEQEARLATKEKQTHQAIAWLQNIARLQAELSDLQQQRKLAEEDLPALQAKVAEHQQKLHTAEGQTQADKQAQEVAQPKLQAMRALDQQIHQLGSRLKEETKEYNDNQQALQASEQKSKSLEVKLRKEQQAMQDAQDYCSAHAQDAVLVEHLSGIAAHIDTLAELHRKSGGATIAAAQTQARQALEAITTQHTAAAEALECTLKGRLLREYQSEKESLWRELALTQKIASLEEHRKELESGKECPLCGATEHPFAVGTVPQPDPIKQQIAALDTLIKNAEQQEKTLNSCNEKHEEAQRRYEDIGELQKNYTQHKAALLEVLQPLGITEVQEAGLLDLRAELEARHKQWQKNSQAQQNGQQRCDTTQGEIEKQAVLIATQKQTFDERKQKQDALAADLKQQRQDRQDRYGTTNPDAEETQLKAAITTAEEAEKNAREEHRKFEAERIALTTKIESLIENITSKTAELAAEGDKKLTTGSLEELEQEQQILQEQRSAYHQSIAALKHELEQNIINQAKIRTHQQLIRRQNKEYQRWERLSDLIGSQNGKKYRSFVQGLTFEVLISQANGQLENMHNRYRLIRDRQVGKDLELNVIDTYQAGELRPIKTLSGGESFIVSLALALGLSAMSSDTISVQSLFLDEGFGTLDQDSLDLALETLASLPQEGKLIGLISHVPAITERISTQIKVHPSPGGRSTLSGPGCEQLG